MRRTALAPALLALLLTGCSGAAEPGPAAPASPSSSAPTASASTTDDPTDEPDDPADDPAYDVALSEPVEDRVYPEVGDPGVDALHYDLDLTWDPDTSRLTGREELTFRATADDDRVQLDLAPQLRVSYVTVDGEPVEAVQRGKDLVVTTDVVADERYVLTLEYAGKPRPVEAPTTRADVPGLGWTVTDDGSVWTMQEPFGAYTWYAVNDQPSDKALYDFRLRSPAPMIGVANGELRYTGREGGDRLSGWHLAEPAASYLVTVAFGDYVSAEETSESGVPVSVWLPRDERVRMAELRRTTVDSLTWTEELLGPYPFDTLGFVFVDSTSGMETQTMVTLGLTDYATSQPVLVHEVVHQWWGNQVTPRDWRDLWMNEGMTMYLQALWESENGGVALDDRVAGWAVSGQELRDQAGPPAAYDAQAFAESNVYYLPAVMWHEVRQEIGGETFFELVREWPAARDNGTSDYRDLTGWWSRESGTDLSAIFRAHLLEAQQPPT